MNKIAFNKKTILAGLAGVALAAGAVVAAPPLSMYNPGETTDPTCAPGDTNCDVKVRGKFVDGINPADAVYTEGNVGIGVTAPSEALEVSGNILLSKEIRFTQRNNAALRIRSGGYDGGAIISAEQGSSGHSELRLVFDKNAPNNKGIYLGHSGDINNEFMTTELFVTLGKVGIGTTNPGSRLTITNLPRGTTDAVVPGNLVGALCITDQGNVYIDTDGTCAN